MQAAPKQRSGYRQDQQTTGEALQAPHGKRLPWYARTKRPPSA